MKIFELLGKTVSIDTDKLSRCLSELHNEHEDKKTVLAFGMLDFKLCELMEKEIKKSIIKQFDDFTYELFKSRIDDFIKEVQKEVFSGVYKYSKMIN